MSDKIKEILDEIDTMKVKLAEEMAKKEKHLGYKIQNGYVEFEQDVLKKQKENMKHLLAYFREIPMLHLLSSPIVYAMVIPAVILDITLFIYQQSIFRIYKFKFVKRSDYIVFDRQYLGYLNPIEKFNCMYCSYFNGLMHYAGAIASRTELYFCPIKHAKKVLYEHEHYTQFLTYGDEEAFQQKLEALREKYTMKDKRTDTTEG